MGHGFSLTRHDGLSGYAEALAEAGAAVLVFDYRHFGDSGGEPRQRFRAAAQLEDFRNAVAYARGLDEVDPARMLVWGYSFAGGTAVNAAAADPGIAGAILLCPFLAGLPRVIAATRASPGGVVWTFRRAFRDQLGHHNVIPVTAQPGSHGAMNFPGEADGFATAVTGGSPWRNEISPGIFAVVAFHRPGAKARTVHCPVWVGLGERDISVSAKAIERFAQRAPAAELHRYDVDHFEPLYGDWQARIAADQADWFHRTYPA
jgi:dienelactone hydrolase